MPLLPPRVPSFVAPWSGLTGGNKLPGVYVTLSRVRQLTGLLLATELPPLRAFLPPVNDPLLRFDAACDAESDDQLRRLGLVPSPRAL